MSSNIHADEGAIRDWFKNYLEAVTKGDSEAYRIFYAEDVVILPPNNPPIYGINALLQMAKALFDKNTVEADFTIEEIIVDENIAFARLSVIEEIIPKDGGESLKDDRKTVWVFRKNADASWSSSHVMWNSNLPA
jgi:uncharacterized protein (TIGR02246 family)